MIGFTTAVTQGCVLDPVHSTPEEFENGRFILKTPQLFSVHTTPEEYYKEEKTRSGKSRDYRDVIVFEMLHFQNFLCPHGNEKLLWLEELRFLDGLVWTSGLTVAIKLRFQILLRIVHVGAAFGRVLSRSTVSSATSLG